jgi:hypothetical protein
MNINLATYIARDDNGNADVSATLDKFAADLDNYIAQRETEESVIAGAVDSVFNDLKEAGTRANKPFIVNTALTKLNVMAHPASYKVLFDKVSAYITANSQGKTDKATGMVENPNSLFIVGRGKAATGVQRRADLPVPESK